MACLTLTMPVIILMSVIFLLSMKTGFGSKQTPICFGRDCITVNHDSVDFETAEEECRIRNGELMTHEPQMDERRLNSLSHVLLGHYWIGLRLPTGLCSNLSAPLRGYEWTSDDTHQSFTPSFNIWKDNVEVCSPHCVSFSNDQKWTERPCSNKTDGYLCRRNVFQDSRGCSTAPCEQDCIDVKGGYVCICFNGYIPDTKDPRQCQTHCRHKLCPLICKTPGSCECPTGYVDNAGTCEDIDECEMKECEQKCHNTFGSFVCSCNEGFVLEGEVHCNQANKSVVIATLNAEGSGKPITNNNSTLKTSSPPASGFLWMWIFGVVAVVGLIFVVRLYVVKHRKCRQQNSLTVC